MKKESILFTLCLVFLIITLAVFLFVDSHLTYGLEILKPVAYLLIGSTITACIIYLIHFTKEK
ncbi:hypothetical protein HO539_03555 [Streptococcus suis]|nr:hypothetical protein [Streptococcus suis]NRG68397.1 hypothetical protein [Streptococcus suis]